MNGNAFIIHAGGAIASFAVSGLSYYAVRGYIGENPAILVALLVFGILIAFVAYDDADDEDESDDDRDIPEKDDQGRDIPLEGRDK